MKWIKGRQDSGYLKIKIIESTKFKFDCYLIKYPTNSSIPKHTDKVTKDYTHNRINIILKKAKKGGIFKCQKYKTYFFKRVIKFKPSEFEHSVSKIEKGNRYILSLGWLKHK